MSASDVMGCQLMGGPWGGSRLSIEVPVPAGAAYSSLLAPPPLLAVVGFDGAYHLMGVVNGDLVYEWAEGGAE